MGRSRGGLTTKIHAVVDAEGMPIALKLTEGQAHDGKSAQDLLGTLRNGDILLAEDTTGQGHISRAVAGKPRKSLFITLD